MFFPNLNSRSSSLISSSSKRCFALYDYTDRRAMQVTTDHFTDFEQARFPDGHWCFCHLKLDKANKNLFRLVMPSHDNFVLIWTYWILISCWSSWSLCWISRPHEQHFMSIKSTFNKLPHTERFTDLGKLDFPMVVWF